MIYNSPRAANAEGLAYLARAMLRVWSYTATMAIARREKFLLFVDHATLKAAFPLRLVRAMHLYQLTWLPLPLFLKLPANLVLKGTFGRLTCQIVSLSRFLMIPNEI